MDAGVNLVSKPFDDGCLCWHSTAVQITVMIEMQLARGLKLKSVYPRFVVADDGIVIVA